MCNCPFCKTPNHPWILIYYSMFEGEYETALNEIKIATVDSTARDLARAILREMIGEMIDESVPILKIIKSILEEIIE